MELYAKESKYKGINTAELSCGKYRAVIAPTIGSNVLRLRDEENEMEILRYDENVSISEIAADPYLWGLQPLYLQNRFEDGILKTSDSIYHLPINEPLRNNHIHGFIHNRAFKLKDMGTDNKRAFAVTEFIYDENDFFFNYFPVCFSLTITSELSEDGFRFTMDFVNNSDKMLPVPVAAHTAFKTPFLKGGRQEDIRLTLPATERITATRERWLPTGEFAELTEYDILYVNGKRCPVLQDINNNHYRAGTVKLADKDFHGCIITDTASDRKIFYETDEKFGYWIVWNQGGFNGFFCPEPLNSVINAPNLNLPREKTGYCEVLPGGNYSIYQRIFTE